MSREVIAEPSPGRGPSPVQPSATAPSHGSWWAACMLSLLGIFEVLMATSAGPISTRLIGLVGGAALIAAPWVTGRARRWRLPLLILGSVPFAVVTWWTLVTPLLAVAALVIGLTFGRRHR